MDGRKQGWLTKEFHLCFREVLLHTLVRHDQLCPTYCLMPDHMHFLWMGTAPDSDQILAARYCRQYVNALLNPYRLQHQPYDHVLREHERAKAAFQKTAYYVLQNPVRAGIVGTASEYAYSGCMVPGYPDLDVHDAEFWRKFWTVYEKRRSE